MKFRINKLFMGRRKKLSFLFLAILLIFIVGGFFCFDYLFKDTKLKNCFVGTAEADEECFNPGAFCLPDGTVALNMSWLPFTIDDWLADPNHVGTFEAASTYFSIYIDNTNPIFTDDGVLLGRGVNGTNYVVNFFDISDENFTITTGSESYSPNNIPIFLSEPSISLLTPNGGDVWGKQVGHQIRWVKNNAPSDITYLTFYLIYPGLEYSIYLGTAPINDGFKDLNFDYIPSVPPRNDYKLRVEHMASLVNLLPNTTYYWKASTSFTYYDPVYGRIGGVANSPTYPFTTPDCQPMPNLNLTANPTLIYSGQSSTLTWSSVNTTSCTVSAYPTNSQWSGSKELSGNQTITNITQTTDFTMTCIGPGGSVERTATVDTYNESPTVSNLQISGLPSWCTNPFQYIMSWTFSDPDPGDTQAAKQIQVSESSGFATIKYDSGKINNSTPSITITNLEYNKTYYWRIKVWDSRGAVSDWTVAPLSFTTSVHAWPTPSFTWVPQTTGIGEDVQFTDTSSGQGIDTWSWSFQDGTPSTSTVYNPVVQFTSGGNKTVQLTVWDDQNYFCSTSQIVGVSTINFDWREIFPW